MMKTGLFVRIDVNKKPDGFCFSSFIVNIHRNIICHKFMSRKSYKLLMWIIAYHVVHFCKHWYVLHFSIISVFSSELHLSAWFESSNTHPDHFLWDISTSCWRPAQEGSWTCDLWRGVVHYTRQPRDKDEFWKSSVTFFLSALRDIDWRTLTTRLTKLCMLWMPSGEFWYQALQSRTTCWSISVWSIL